MCYNMDNLKGSKNPQPYYIFYIIAQIEQKVKLKAKIAEIWLSEPPLKPPLKTTESLKKLKNPQKTSRIAPDSLLKLVSKLFDNFGNHTRTNRLATFADSEAVLVVHRHWRE